MPFRAILILVAIVFLLIVVQTVEISGAIFALLLVGVLLWTSWPLAGASIRPHGAGR